MLIDVDVDVGFINGNPIQIVIIRSPSERGGAGGGVQCAVVQ